MKKFIAALSAALLLAALAGCSSDEDAIERGEELIRQMAELAGDRDYVEYAVSGIFNSSEVLEKIAEGDYDEARHIYRVTLPDMDDIDEISGARLDDLTDTVANKLYRSIPTLVERSISMRTDSSFYVTASYISRGTTYVDRSLKEPVMYFYFYRDGNPAVVNLSPGRDGAVSMAAYFLPEGEISGSGEDSLRDDLEELIYDNLDLELDLEVKELK